MELTLIALLLLGFLLAVLAAGLWIGLALLVTGAAAIALPHSARRSARWPPRRSGATATTGR